MTKRNNKAPAKDERFIVVCHNGEEFVAGKQTTQGVEFDGGIIPWSDVLGFRSWSDVHGRWFSIPLD